PAAEAGERALRICIIENHAGASGSRLIPRFPPSTQTDPARVRIYVAMSRPILAQINLSALRSNLDIARAKAPEAQLLAVVKANAYGHGLIRVLPVLAGADGLALLELDAAVAVREQHYARRILLLQGFFTADELPEIAARRLAVVVHHSEQVRMLETASLKRPLEVFVKVNTGMNRLGFKPNDVHAMVERLSRVASVAVLRLMTHLARPPRRRRCLRLCRWLSAARAERDAGSGLREEGAHRGSGVDGYARGRPDRCPGGDHRQPRRTLGRGAAGR